MRHYSLVVLSVAVVALGCGECPTPAPTSTAAKTDQSSASANTPAVPVDPAVAVSAETFMRAILSGDSTGAAQLLTTKAAKRYAADPSVITPMGMRVERLQIGEVRMLGEDEAAAQCVVNEVGTESAQELCCLLKREQAGWFVCGLACNTAAGTAVVSFEEGPEEEGQFVEDPRATSSVPRTATAPGEAGLR